MYTSIIPLRSHWWGIDPNDACGSRSFWDPIDADIWVNSFVFTTGSAMTVGTTTEVVEIAFDNTTFGVLKLAVVTATFVLKLTHDRVTYTTRATTIATTTGC